MDANLIGLVIGLMLAGILAYFVQQDAKKVGMSETTASLWGCGTFLFAIVFLPLYLLFRLVHGDKSNQIIQTQQPINLRKCPYCAEMIQKEAKLCKHCKQEVEPIEEAF